VGENLRQSLFIPGLPPSYMTIHLWSSAISHPPRSLIPPRCPGPPCQHVAPGPSALMDSCGDIRPPVQRRSRESRRCDTLPSLNAGRSVAWLLTGTAFDILIGTELTYWSGKDTCKEMGFPYCYDYPIRVFSIFHW
jgi:hypothetical protein